MRILFVVDEPLVPTNSGGRAETRAEIELLRTLGHEVDVVMCAAKRVPAHVLELQRRVFGNVEFVRLRSVLGATLRHPFHPLFCARRMPRRSVLDGLEVDHAKRERVDVVIAAHEYTLPLASALRKRVGGRLVLRSHNDEAAYFQGLARGARAVRRIQFALDASRLRRRMSRLVRPVDLIAVISPADAVAYPPEAQVRIVDVPPVLAAPRGESAVAPFDQREERLVFVGSLDVGYALNGISWFLSGVWPLVQAQRPCATVEIVGRGSGASLRALIGETPGVVVSGEVPDLAPVLDRARVFINPVFEGSGVNMKIGPPMSRGLPVVTTPVGLRGLEALGPGMTSAATAREFADACSALLTDKDRWSAASAAGRALLDSKYSSSAVAQSWSLALGLALSHEAVR